MTLLKSPHISESDWQKYNQNDYGSKVDGLKYLPDRWNPPYIVIPTEYFNSWLKSECQDLDSAEELLPSDRIIQATKEVLDCWQNMRPSPAHLGEEQQEKIIVRSSALATSLRNRGEFLSKTSPPDKDEIIQSIYNIWNQAHKSSELEKERPVLGIIIQAKVRKSGIGHLSNERRVSRISTNWTIEWEKGLTEDEEKHKRFSGQRIEPTDTSNPLTASSPDAVENKLKQIAAWSQNQDHRSHYEWVWNGSSLWLVQNDVQKTERRPEPGSRWTYDYPHDFTFDFDILNEAQEAQDDWSKTKCLEVFEKCGLDCPDLFLLRGDILRSHLTNGTIDDGLKAEFDELLEAPVVVRTDVKSDDKSTEVFSPRSDTLINTDKLISFIKENNEKFLNRGHSPSDFCFLIHHFMVSKASALAQASPGNPLVSIDGIWGIPDGLNYYPHDSFRVNIDQEEIDFRKPRCKDRYLDVDSSGEWIERPSGKPWDWKTSLSDNALFSIAEQAQTISRYLDDSVVVMFFVELGIEAMSGESIPWFFWFSEDRDSDVSSSSIGHWSSSTYSIRTPDDLNKLMGITNQISKSNHAIIEFNPSPDYVRDTDFIEQVSDFAEELGIPIRLEGSTLSHAYYILRRSNATVRAAFESEPVSRSIRFSKLVRDQIPIKIESGGEETRTYEVPPDDLVDLLKSKIVEEALEFGYAETSDDEIEELADVFEIIRAYTEAVGTTLDEVKALADDKREDKGGFSEGIVLVSTQNRGGIQDSLSENHDERNQPKLPTPFFPDPKMYDDLNPREKEDDKTGITIEAPLIPPPLRGLERFSEFQLPDLDVRVRLEYEEDRLLLYINKNKSTISRINQSALDDFT